MSETWDGNDVRGYFKLTRTKLLGLKSMEFSSTGHPDCV